MKDSKFGRVFGVLVSPTETYRSIVARPNWAIPILVFVIVSMMSAAITGPRIDWQGTIDTKLERAGREAPRARIDTIVEFMDEHVAEIMVLWSMVAPWLLFPVLALIYVGFFRMMGSDLSLERSMAVVAHGTVPWSAATLLSLPIALTTESINLYERNFLAPNLTVFAGEEVGLELWIFLATIDLSTFWAIGLMVIGFSLATRIPKLRVAVGLIALWALWTVFMVGMAALE